MTRALLAALTLAVAGLAALFAQHAGAALRALRHPAGATPPRRVAWALGYALGYGLVWGTLAALVLAAGRRLAGAE